MSEPAPAKSGRHWLWIFLGFSAFWFAYVTFFLPRDAEPPAPPRVEGMGSALGADYAWTLEDLDGRLVSFSMFKGRPVVLNFWATWCGPCRNEMPSLVRLAADARLEGVAYVCVTDEPSAAVDKIRGYAKAEMPGLTVLRAEGRPDVFRAGGIPATFVLDGEGKVVASQVGAAEWDDPTVVALLEGLLRKARPDTD